MKNYILLLLLVAFWQGCKQPDPGPTPTYTVKGRVINGTTGAVPPPQSLDIGWINTNKDVGDICTAKMDAAGSFSFTYHEAGKGPRASISINGPFLQITNVPINRNIDSTFYSSSMGNIKLNLVPKTPMTSKDTLFIGFAVLNSNGDITGIEIDTILNSVNGYYKTVRYPPPAIGIYYARGWQNFGYDPARQRFSGNKSSEITFKVSGDPYTDNGTINY